MTLPDPSAWFPAGLARRGPISEQALVLHLRSLGVPDEGIKYVIASAAQAHADPSEDARKRNITGEFAANIPATLDGNEKHWRLPFDSLSGEYAYHVIAEADPTVLFALDHPQPVSLTVKDRRGRTRRISYTPDGLRVTFAGIQVQEIKSKDELAMLCETHGANWVKRDGQYHYIQPEEVFRTMGIDFSVVVREELPWLRVQNIQLLKAGIQNNDLDEEHWIPKEIASYVDRHSPCSVLEIMEALKLPTAAFVLRMIANGQIHVDFDKVSLADPYSRVICSTENEAKNIGFLLSSIQSIAATKETVSLLDMCDPSHIGEFAYRVGIVTGQPVERVGKGPPSIRTIHRWVKIFKEEGFEGLIPKFFLCGKKGTRTPEWHLDIALRTIKADRSSSKRPTRRNSHYRYKKILREEAELRGTKEVPLSYSHYCRLWGRRRHSVEDAMSKGGRRLANAVAPHGDVDQQVPLATRPFQVAHVDHCLAPAYTQWEEVSHRGLPWLTLIVDAYTNETLARAIRFEYPSYETDALVLRDCVRRHGRLPEGIISDGGADFRSRKLRECFATLHLNWFKRAPAFARAGQPVERSFLTFATAVCAGKDGFMPDICNRRSIDSSKYPERGPRRMWHSLVADTDRLLFDVLPTLRGNDGTPSAREMRFEFEDIYGPQGKQQALDLRFLVATAVPIECKGKTEPAGAIRYAEKRYYSTALYTKSLAVSTLHPRHDPEDRSVIYYKLDGNWHVAKTRESLHNRGRSDAEILADSSLIRPLTATEREAKYEAMCADEDPEQCAQPKASDELQKSEETGKSINTADEVGEWSIVPDWSSVPSLPDYDPNNPAWRES